jgi:hypothetical protein
LILLRKAGRKGLDGTRWARLPWLIDRDASPAKINKTISDDVIF